MTAPLRSPGRAPRIGDARGLTAAGGVLLALLLGLAGALYDVLTGPGPADVFAISFVAGAVLVALTVHREDLVAAVVMPPLVYVVLTLVAGAVDGPLALTTQLLGLVNALVLGAPVLLVATGGALLVVLLRRAGGR